MVAAGAFQNGTNLFTAAAQRYELRHPLPRVLNFKWSVHDLSPGFIPHTVLFPLDTSIPILSMGIPSFLIKYCNASAPAYYDSNWFVTRTRHSRSNLLNRIFITRGRRTVYSSSAWLIKETVHPLPSHYNKNKHSFRGFLYASGAMLIFVPIKEYAHRIFVPSLYHKSEDCKSRPILLRFLHKILE